MTIRAGEEVGMRGANNEQSSMFSYISAERRVPKDHPLRAIRAMADMALKALDQRFAGMYAALGRPSIAPERLLRAVAAGLVHRAQRTAADGATRLQFPVPVVRGTEY
jgi:transposase